MHAASCHSAPVTMAVFDKKYSREYIHAGKVGRESAVREFGILFLL